MILLMNNAILFEHLSGNLIFEHEQEFPIWDRLRMQGLPPPQQLTIKPIVLKTRPTTVYNYTQ